MPLGIIYLTTEPKGQNHSQRQAGADGKIAEQLPSPEAIRAMADYLEGVCGCSSIAAKSAAADVIDFAKRVSS